jgi:hypothetical protein
MMMVDAGDAVAHAGSSSGAYFGTRLRRCARNDMKDFAGASNPRV